MLETFRGEAVHLGSFCSSYLHENRSELRRSGALCQWAKRPKLWAKLLGTPFFPPLTTPSESICQAGAPPGELRSEIMSRVMIGRVIISRVLGNETP